MLRIDLKHRENMKKVTYITDQKRIFGLDIIRALAIMTVLIGHGSFMLVNTPLQGFPYIKLLDGVDLFFVLSGFLLGSILLKDINNKDGFNIRKIFHFWKRRWFRTLPNYYLILFFNYLFVYYKIAPGDLKNFDYSFLIFTQNFRFPLEGFFLESWSLAVVEWFYLITPILIYILFKRYPAKKAFLFAVLIMIIMPIMYRIKIYQPGISSYEWDVTFRKTVMSRLDSIGYGLLASWIYFYCKTLWRKVRIPALMIGLLIAYYVLNFNQSEFYHQVLYFILSPLSIMFIMPFAHSIKNGKGIGAFIIQHISKISYSMYLINLGLVSNVIMLHYQPKGSSDGIIKFIIYCTIVFSTSSLLYKYFEKPVMNLRDKDLSLKTIVRKFKIK